MTVQRSFRLLLIVLVTVAVSPACYTLIKHPQVKTDGLYQEVEERQCTNCHYEDEIWSYHHPPNHRYYSGSRYDNWASYYEVPWWYESYWFYTPPATTTVPPQHRSFRPDGDGQMGTPGATVGGPPGMKSQGASVRTTGTDTDAARKGESDDSKSKSKDKKRTVRPKGKKEKEDG
jgi:hypothetical protein